MEQYQADQEWSQLAARSRELEAELDQVKALKAARAARIDLERGREAALASWEARLREAALAARQRHLADARSGDIRNYARPFGGVLSAMIAAHNATGRLIDLIDPLIAASRNALSDTTGDGFLNLSWLQARVGGEDRTRDIEQVDRVVMEEILGHGVLSAVAVTLLDESLKPGAPIKYERGLSRWVDYLANHYTEKWIGRLADPATRPGGQSLPFIIRPFHHVHARATLFHFNMWRLTGERWHLDLAEKLAGVIRSRMVEIRTPDGPGWIWPHQYNVARSIIAPFHYTSQVFIPSAVLLNQAGFSWFADDEDMKKIARAWAWRVVDRGSHSFAPNIAGGPHAGFSPNNQHERYSADWWANSCCGMLALWDQSGRIDAVNRELIDARRPHFRDETNLPAIMMLTEAKAGIPF